MAKSFTVTRDGNLPPYVNSRTVGIWNDQRKQLLAHPQAASWLVYSEWPEFLDSVAESVTTETLTQDQKRPLLRDIRYSIKVDVPTLWAKKESLKELLRYLRQDAGFEYDVLLDLTAVDFQGSPDEQDMQKNGGKRFQVWYLLRSLKKPGLKIRVVLPLGEDESAPSVTDLWVGANWPEREVFDLMGIVFDGHPNLHRILLPDQYRGHPLRKDFPIKGIGEDYLIQNLLDEHIETD